MAKTLTGVVASDKADKTIVVAVQTRKTHPIYKKQYTITRRFMAHDEANDAHIGDRVIIAESKPLSARKRYRLLNITERAPIRHTEADANLPRKQKKSSATLVESVPTEEKL